MKPYKAAVRLSRGRSMRTPGSDAPCIVAIGASAGGFDALVEFLGAMPADSGMAFVIVQHLSPSPRSLSAELFSHHTSMPVRVAESGMRIEANHVYTAPAGRDISITNGRIRLSKPTEQRGRRLPVDHFFRSLGQDQHERAIGIILSGTGSDGTLGLRTIVANGGIVLVQSPETAQYDGMPRSALATGVVAHVLSIAQMPRVLVGYSRHAYVHGEPSKAISLSRNSLQPILELLHAQQGRSFSGYKQGTLERRISRRMGLLGITSLNGYLRRLRRDKEEAAALSKDLLIGVTEFFRDRQSWQALTAQVLRPLVASKKAGEPIRAWTAGAATGEEAYTLAILIL
jgi:two-component system CheB/CheR fusion protein